MAWLAALSALAAALSSIADLHHAGNETLVVQAWRMYGLFLCAGLFAVLARQPDRNGAIWALMIANKLALTVTAIYFLDRGGVADAGTTVAWDGGLTVALIAAFVLCSLGTRARARADI
ncbi:hypothetical protein AB0N05_27645 [Nocardia sp. NPDC051030]|uniref:hypothetical protein n=1 Tax=Nocardia sp. NPDC051030 TaxID=3155162 RepID=UPI003423CB4C